jgi:hypothetical protein
MRTPRGRFEGKALDRGGIGTVPAIDAEGEIAQGLLFRNLDHVNYSLVECTELLSTIRQKTARTTKMNFCHFDQIHFAVENGQPP